MSKNKSGIFSNDAFRGDNFLAAANKKYESESDSFDDEPIPRKKTRATNDLTNKKNDDKHNEKRLSSDKKIANQALPRKETRSSHSERRTENSSQRDKSASQDPKNKSKLQQKIANKKGVPSKDEKSKPSPDKTKDKKPINAKRPRSVEKESPKDKGKGDKKQGSGKKDEKQEKNDKRGDKGHKNEKNDKQDKHDKSEKREKEDRDRSSKSDARRKKEDEKDSVEKDEKRQTRADKAQEAKDLKKLQTKQQTEKEKQMAEFTKKYPQYIVRGKFKFPIEDRLFDLYSAIFEEHLPEVKRPKPRPGFIPAKDLGDILQIWNFFSSFPELFKFEDIEKEEIYAGLKYSGDECLGLLNDMHQGILSLYLLEFIKKNRFETSRDETDHPFFVLIKYQTGNMTQHGDELAVIWTEFANQLAGISPFGDHYTETLKRYFKNLATKTCLHYNKLEYKQKIKILLNLIEGIYETDVFKEFLQSKMDATSALIKERNDLNNEIKQDEQEFIALKAKLAQAQKGVKKADFFRGNSSTRLESLRRPRNATDTGKQDVIQRYTDELNVLEELINKKQETVDAINSELVLTLQTATFIGVDGDKTEYWVFQAEPDRVYIRNPSIMSTDEEWYYYNTKADILALVDSLNTKGIKESQLQEQLLDLIENGTIIFDEDELEEEEEEVKTPKRRGRPKKKTEEELAKEEEEEAKIEASKLTKSGSKRMEVEDEDDDDDGYVVRRKDNGEANKNKESAPKETPVVAEEKIGDEMNIEKPETTTENVEDKVEEKKEAEGVEEEVQKVEEPVEEEKVIEEKAKKAHEEKEIARQKELDIEREKEQERIRERERAHEERLQRLQRKLQEANSELNFDYWFAKVLEYQAPEEPTEETANNVEVAIAVAAENTNAGENPNEPQSADKQQEQQEQAEAQPEVTTQKLTAKKKSPQDLNLDFIKRMLLETEEYLTTYLVKWEARWAHPDIRKDLIQNLKDANTIEELRPVLLKLNEFFQYSETPRGRRGRPVRNKSNEEEKEGEVEGDNMEEEDEEDEEDKDEWGSKKSDEEGGEIEEEEKANPETENVGESEIRTEKDDADKEHKSSATKAEKPPGTKTEQVKKMPLKFWGAFTSRLKKSWATYTAEADNLGAIYFATFLLCETVNVYVEKKNARYFTEYKTGKEYLAAKKRQKEEAYEQRAEAEQAAIEAITEPRNAPVQANRDYLDRSTRQTRAARGPVTRGYRYNDNRYVVDDDSQEKSSTESDSMVSRLRKRTRRPPKFPDEIYTRKPNKAQEALRLRQQQERLEELAGLRRSTRIGNQIRKKYTSLDEQQWYKECKVCLKSDGDFIACSNCSDYYHPACVGLDNTQPPPEEGWTCGPCVEHIANSRQTRSSARRIQL